MATYRLHCPPKASATQCQVVCPEAAVPPVKKESPEVTLRPCSLVGHFVGAPTLFSPYRNYGIYSAQLL